MASIRDVINKVLDNSKAGKMPTPEELKIILEGVIKTFDAYQEQNSDTVAFKVIAQHCLPKDIFENLEENKKKLLEMNAQTDKEVQ